MEATRISLRLKVLLVSLAAVVALCLSPLGMSYAYSDEADDEAATSQSTQTAVEADEADEEVDAAALDGEAAGDEELGLQELSGDEQLVTIGQGTTESYKTAPFYCYNKNGATETIYTADEIGMAGTINALAWQATNSNTLTVDNLKIYLGHTTASSFSDSAITPDDLTLVYSSTENFAGIAGFRQIVLDTPFEYNGTDNLLVVVVWAGHYSGAPKFYVESKSGMVWAKTSDSYPSDFADWATIRDSTSLSASYPSERPNIQLAIEEDVAEGAPVIKTDSLPSCNLGAEYNATIKVKANPAATVSVTGLPAGLSFDPATLAISGTPTQAGTFQVTITASNGIEPDASATLPLAVTTEAPAITTESMPNGKVGKAYSATIEATGVPAPTISVGTLPAGLEFDPATNTISGTPTEAGEASVTVTASNGYGDDAVQTFTFTIKSATASEEIEVVIGAGTTSAKQSNGVPFHPYYKNAVTQSVYLSSEIVNEGEAVEEGTINAISYYVTDSNSHSPSLLNIYLGYTNATEAGSTGLAIADRALVYTRTNATIGSAEGWETYELDEPFEYDSSKGNLLVTIVRTASSDNSALGYQASAGKTGMYRKDSNPITDIDAGIAAISTTVNYRANIKLSMEVGAAAPKFSDNPQGFTYKAGDPQNTQLSATATSKVGAPSFSWYKSSDGNLADAAAVIASATEVAGPAEGTAVDGAYVSTYTPAASDLTTAGTVYYYCIAADSVGSTASKPAAVQVYTEDARAPGGTFAITSVPAAEGGVVTAGETTTVTFTAAGAEPAVAGDELYYQWYKKGTGDADFVAIDGATDTTYAATVVVGETAYQCRVHASHQIPANVSADVTSNTITINGTALTIYTVQDLVDFRNAVNGGDNFNGRTVLLGADIDISDINWVGIGKSGTNLRFAGTFDGQGHTITIGSFDTSTTGTAAGLFGYARGEATIKNLTVAGTIESDQYNVAAVCNTSYGATFENVRNLANVSTTDTSGRVAGIVASVGGGGADDPTVFTNCVNKGNISTAGSNGYASGIANLGATSGGCIATFENCYNTGTISGVATMYGDCYISGIVSINKSNTNANTLTNCYNAGALSGGSYNRGYGLASRAVLVGNNYYLEGAPDGGIGTNSGDGSAVSKTADEMADAAFLTLLGEAYAAGSELGLDPAQATPCLAWEAAGATPAIDPGEAQARVDAAVAAYNAELGALKPSFYNGDMNIVDYVQARMEAKTDLNLEGVTVSLKSSDEPDWIAADGAITYNAGELNAWGMNSKNVATVFTFTCAGQSADTGSRNAIIGWNQTHYNGKMNTEAEALTFDLIKGENESADAIASDLTLPQIFTSSSRTAWGQITWTSSEPNVISIEATGYDTLLDPKCGKINRPAEDTTVTLTATIKANEANLNTNVEQVSQFATITKTFEVTVTGDNWVPLNEEQLGYLLDKYYIPELAYTDEFGGGAVASGDTIDGDLQLPRYTRIRFRDGDEATYVNPESTTLVFNNREITVTSNNPAITINGYKGAVDRFCEDGATTLTITFTREGVTATRTINLTVDTITDAELDAEIALMELAKAHYWDAINDGVYTSPEMVTGNLHPFQEINVDEQGNPVYVYTSAEKTGTGIIPDGYFEDSEQAEAAGYNRFRSSEPTILQHENLVLVTRPETSTRVTITSWLSSDLYGDLAPLHPENAKLQQLYKQEVSATVTVLDPNDPGDPIAAAIEDQTIKVRAGEAFEEAIAVTGRPYPAIALAEGSALPEGVTLSEEGVLTGQLTTIGESYSFDVTAANAGGTATATVTLMVVPKYETVEGTAYLTVTQNGVFATAKGDSGMLMDYVPFDLADVSAVDLDDYGLGAYKQDQDEDGSYDVTALQLFVLAHEQYSTTGVAGLVAQSSAYGLYITGFWGVDCSGNLTYSLDGETLMLTADKTYLSDGSDVGVYTYEYSFYEDPNNYDHYFIDSVERVVHNAEATTAQASVFTLQQKGYDSEYYPVSAPAAGYSVSYGTTYGVPVETLTTANDGTVQILFPEAGTWYVWADGELGASEDLSDKIVSTPARVTVTVTAEKKAIELAGDNRYATAAAIAKTAYPEGAEGVIIATGANFPDALGAASLAGMLDYPILLTETASLTPVTAEAIAELGASKVIVVGGIGAVSSKAFGQLRNIVGAANVKRIYGNDRYLTADAVFGYGRDNGEWGKTAIIATGKGYADTLSISGWAFATKSPIFLCDPSKGLSAGTKTALSQGGFEQVVIVGGTGVVPASAETYAKGLVGDENVTRLGGSDRYDTSKKIAEFVLANGGTADKACIATGSNFPDALAGSALVGRNGSILLLADPGKLTALGVLTANKDSIDTIYYLGGIGAVPQAVRTAAENAIGK